MMTPRLLFSVTSGPSDPSRTECPFRLFPRQPALFPAHNPPYAMLAFFRIASASSPPESPPPVSPPAQLRIQARIFNVGQSRSLPTNSDTPKRPTSFSFRVALGTFFPVTTSKRPNVGRRLSILLTLSLPAPSRDPLSGRV